LAKLKEMLLSDPSRLNRPDTYSLDSRAEVTPLNAAIAAHQEEISNYLFQAGADVNARDNHWGTALHTAVKTQQPDLVKVLLEKGADINCKDKEKDTPLIYCCGCFCLKEEEMGQSFMALLENDHLDLNAKNSDGESALSMAVNHKNCWQVAALVKKGAEIPPDLEEKVKQYIEWYHAGIYAM
jgi:ankyrin repeat protein